MSKETAKYAINKDLSVESLHSFSSPEGDEFAYDVDYECEKYFAPSYEEALKKAARNELPVPTFRIGLGFFVGRLTA